MHKSHKIKLYPTKRQEVYFRKACGVARFAFNWALDQWQKKYEKGEKTSAYSLIKELTAIKRDKYPWMVKNHKLAQHLNDASFGETRRQLAYKCKWAGKELLVADRWFASSKICSSCGYKKPKMKLSERKWTYPECGVIHDRDVNAAINLVNYSPTSETEGSKACGDGKVQDVSSVVVSEARTNLNVKQLKI